MVLCAGWVRFFRFWRKKVPVSRAAGGVLRVIFVLGAGGVRFFKNGRFWPFLFWVPGGSVFLQKWAFLRGFRFLGSPFALCLLEMEFFVRGLVRVLFEDCSRFVRDLFEICSSSVRDLRLRALFVEKSRKNGVPPYPLPRASP